MLDSDDVMYHLPHVHLGLAKVTYVARIRVWIIHLVLHHIIQPFINNAHSHKIVNSSKSTLKIIKLKAIF